MTLFGKFVFTVLAIVLAFAIFLTVTSLVRHDAQEEVLVTKEEVTPQDTASSTETTATSTATSTEVKQGETSSNKKPFYELLGTTGDRKCSITQMMGTVTSNGTVYTHDGLVRAEFTTSIANNTIKSTMLARDGYMYTWTDNAPTKGSKTKMPTLDANGKVTAQTGVKTWDGSQVKDYTCSDWKPDTKLFEVPETVTFTTQ